MKVNMAQVSSVIPLLNEQDNIHLLYKRLCEVAESMHPHELEMVFVDDGSTDASPFMLKQLAEQDHRVKLIRLSRNFGSYAAIAAGYRYSTGDVVVNLSADLQDPPELILRLMEKWLEGNEIVWAVRESRKDPWSTKLFAALYYRLMRQFALPQMPLSGMDICLVDRRVIESLDHLQERNTSLFGLIMWSGFTQAFLSYHREERRTGKSKWSSGKKIKLFIDSFVAFSFFPIRLISCLGLFISVVGFFYAIFVILAQWLFSHPAQGWTSLMVVILVLSGFQLLMLGIVSEYLWRTLDATRHRPLYIVREVCSDKVRNSESVKL